MDFMWLEGDPVLHVVDVKKRFQNAVFMENKSAEKLWDHFIRRWASLYAGHPNRIRLDQERSFLVRKFRAKDQFQGIELQFSGFYGHDAIGPGKRYYYPLRRIYSKLRAEHPKVTK